MDKPVVENSTDVSAELTAEFVLSHVIHNVCRFLNVRDLYIASKVCRLWEDAAVHAMNKIGPKMSVIPFYDDIKDCDLKLHLLNEIGTKPHISLLFFNRSHFRHTFYQRSLDYVINKYKEQLECDIIALDSEETYFNTYGQVNVKGNFGIPSLFLPLFKQSNLVISYCMKEDGISSAMYAQKMYKELISDYEDSKIILILLTASQKGTNIARKLLTMIQRNHEHEKCSVWGNEFYSLKTVKYDPSNSQTIKEPTMVGIRICGPSINCWSFILDANLKPDKFEEQLLKFKENIKLKRHSLGLACGPALVPPPASSTDANEECQDSLLFMNIIKKVFPDVTFIGEFSYEFYFNAYGCDSTSNGIKAVVALMSVSMMIITFD